VIARADMGGPAEEPRIAPAPAPGDSESLEAFLSVLASAAPVPGGGAAGALTGALAAALVAKVCRVTARREPPAAELVQSAQWADQLRERLARLVGEDAAAYRGLLEAQRQRATSSPDAVQAAWLGATETPLELARSGRAVLVLCHAVSAGARPSVLGDLGVAVSLAWAALEAGAATARDNLTRLADPQFVRASERELDTLLAEGRRLRQQASEVIVTRTAVPD
jgi:formiminotetrahydrofolate cyclodeaminase